MIAGRKRVSSAQNIMKAVHALLLLLCLLQGCASPWQKLLTRADAAGVSYREVSGSASGAPFTHAVFIKPGTDTHAVTIFIEGDGLPWRKAGTERNDDPRPRHALAFNVFLKTPGTAWYITRPCYGPVMDTACTPLVWTDARYSQQNVLSMAAALNSLLAGTPQITQVRLVGYSGGGTLAVLLAPHVQSVHDVVTVAANLDTQAWTLARHFSPLSGSLNPATDLAAPSVPHLALHGLRDEVVPMTTLSGFIQHHPDTRWLRVAQYDHVCCWERDWPQLWQQINALLAAPVP